MAESRRLIFSSASFLQNCVCSHTAHTRGHTRVEFIGSWGPKGKLCRICGIIFSTSGAAGEFWIFYCRVIAQRWQAAILWEYFHMYVISIFSEFRKLSSCLFLVFLVTQSPKNQMKICHFGRDATPAHKRLFLASISNEDQIVEKVRWNMADADAGFSRLISSWRVFRLTTAGLVHTHTVPCGINWVPCVCFSV